MLNKVKEGMVRKLLDSFVIETEFGRNLISSIICKSIYKQLGVNVNLQINELSGSFEEGDEAEMHLDVSLRIQQEDLLKLVTDSMR